MGPNRRARAVPRVLSRVLQPGEKESWKDYTVFKTVTWIGSGAPMQAPDGWLVLGSSPEEALILPERTIDWFSHNRKSLDILCTLVEAYGRGDLPNNAVLTKLISSLKELAELPEMMGMLGDASQVEEVTRIKDELWTVAKNLESGVNDEVEQAMNDAKMALSGAELLEALSDGAGFQRKLKEATGHVIQEAMQKARDELAVFLEPASLRCPYEIFTNAWPAKIDRQTIDGIDAALELLKRADARGDLSGSRSLYASIQDLARSLAGTPSRAGPSPRACGAAAGRGGGRGSPCARDRRAPRRSSAA